MNEHALISPSSASRQLVCTPSARLEATLLETTSSYADEGTLAHLLGELLINRALFRIKRADYEAKLATIKANTYYNVAMLKHCKAYCAHVLMVYNKARSIDKNAVIWIETRVWLNEWIPESFGTADVIIACEGHLWFIDLKYGEGVPVDATDNMQLKIYALGAIYALIGVVFKTIVHISLTIFQPRLDSISTFDTDVVALIKWGLEWVRPRAKLAWEGKGEFVAGKHCQFCRAKPNCAAHAKHHMALAKDTFKEPALLDAVGVAKVLTVYQTLINWARSVHEYALKQALAGKTFPGFKLVVGRSDRVITNKTAAAKRLKAAGYEDFMTEPQLKGITELEKMMGKSDFEHLLGKLIMKPPGAPALVPESDKRKPYSKQGVAKEVFK